MTGKAATSSEKIPEGRVPRFQEKKESDWRVSRKKRKRVEAI